MRKLIEYEKQEHHIICDNVTCDFTIPNDGRHLDTYKFINVPCPKCGENLLTYQDWKQAESFIKMVNWINRWFSWITIFSWRNPKKREGAYVHFHKGMHITKK